MNNITIIPIKNLPEFSPKHDLADELIKGFENNNITLEDNDVIVVTQKIVSKAENRLVENDFENIEELILGCSHYPLIYDFLRKKVKSNIKIIDPSEALIKKFNESFAIPKTDRYESLSLENVKFFVTSERDEFSKKVKFWLEINKEISLVNLRSNV